MFLLERHTNKKIARHETPSEQIAMKNGLCGSILDPIAAIRIWKIYDSFRPACLGCFDKGVYAVNDLFGASMSIVCPLSVHIF